MKEQGRESWLSWPRWPLPFALVCLLATCGDGIGGRYGGEAGYVWHVDADAPGPGRDGKTWTTAFFHPADALDRARSGDELWVAEGTYARRGSGDTVLLTMKDGVSIYGGFTGIETSRDERDWTAHVTTLDGEGNVYHVVVGASDGTLDGFTLTGGNANGSAWLDKKGGGMYNSVVTNLTVANCTFSGNSAWDYGGGIYRWDSSLIVTNCVFSGNGADYGGGMYNSFSSPTVTGCTFSGNTSYFGGGMYNLSSSPTVANCTFSANWSDYGGGMYNSSSSPTVRDCTFSGNSSDYGGGMRNSVSSPTVTNCTFLGNSATYRGGGTHNYDCEPTVTNCILWGNSASVGPEVYNIASSPKISYCDVQGCGGSGGGWDASVGTDGGGNTDSDPLFVNAPLRIDLTAADGTTTTAEITDASSNYAANDVIEIADDGVARTASSVLGTTVTFAPALPSPSMMYERVDNWGPGAVDLVADLHLSAGSPCIDAADGPAAPGTDIEGNARVDDPAAGNTGLGPPWADMGAYEYQP